ncbi:hypothetical protein [Persephonella sp.]
MKKIFVLLFAFYSTTFAFPFDHMGGEEQGQQMMGCIGDCAACHSLTPIEAQSILGQKFDVKKVLRIDIKDGFFEVEYENSKGEKEKINLFFSKDKACREVINLNE